MTDKQTTVMDMDRIDAITDKMGKFGLEIGSSIRKMRARAEAAEALTGCHDVGNPGFDDRSVFRVFGSNPPAEPCHHMWRH